MPKSSPRAGTTEKGKGTCRGSSAAFTNKKVRQPLAAGKGDLIAAEERIKAIKLLAEGVNLGVPMQAIADLLGVCQRTLRRWRIHISGKGFSVDQRKGAQRNVAHKLSIQERQNIINVINEMRFAHLPPAQIVAILAEEGNYIGSEMTIYRIMREEGLLNHRGRARQIRKKREVPMLEARGIKQVLAWDITLLPSPIIGRYYYLYMVMDVWSRRILGVEVHGEQCGKLAGEFFDRICRDEKINKESAAVLHSDNGAPMRSFTLAAKMAELGISLSFSRPRVSNDNAFAESIFRTLKYHHSYPHRRFRDILSVREWVDQFIAWYNTEHRHSGIKYVTPNQRHFGLADNICEIRRSTYEEAKRKHPKRWSRHIKNWQQPEIVKINHPRPIKSIEA